MQDNVLLAELGARTFVDSFGAQNTPENMAAYLTESFSPQQQAAELANPATVFLIAQVANTVVGYAKLHKGPAPDCISGENPIEIARFYACQDWIGHGVGAALMQSCLAHAQQQSCDVAWLDVWEQNPRAIAFYRKWRFREVGTQVFKLGNDLQNDLLMQRPVAL
ncbi:MAG: GNAT family N-acetyltransferase [Anaerolineales bacterium]|nr:GNAT family N-acetyltransferase [Anaerolineales bacterium]